MRNWRKLTFTKIFWNYQKQESFRNESLHNRVINTHNNSTKVKNNLIRQISSKHHSDRIEYLRSYKVEVINDTEWKNASEIVQDLANFRNIALH
nr:hypothetical protein [Mycoplasmopsis bovis]